MPTFTFGSNPRDIAGRILVSASTSLILLYRRVAPAHIRRSCRFQPTCSQYALEAILRFGFARGWGLALERLRRCRPPFGGHDPCDQSAITLEDSSLLVASSPQASPQGILRSPRPNNSTS